MENKLLNALVAHYNAQLQRAEANLVNYFNNPSAIGEHPDVVGEMVKLIDNVAAARNGLAVLQSYVQQPEAAEGAEGEAAAPAEEN